jgi:integrase
MTDDVSHASPTQSGRRSAPRASTGSAYRPRDPKTGKYLRIWWLNYVAPGGRRIRESSGSSIKAVALAKLRQRLGEVGHGQFAGPQAERVTFEDLMNSLERSYQLAGRRSIKRLKQARAHLARTFAGTRAVQITAVRLEAYAVARTVDGAAPASIKYELAILRRAFSLAVKQDRLALRPSFPTIRVQNARSGFFEVSEFEAVIAQLPPPLKNVARFAYHTGWRSGEIRSLRAADVDWAAGVVRLAGTRSKNEEARTFPFAALPALALAMERQRAYTDGVQKRTGQIVTWLFHREGKPIRSMDAAWRSACIRAGVPGRIMHDFRRTAVRNLERAGVPRSVAMKLTGHKTEAVYQRYAIVAERDLAEGVAKLAALEPRPASQPLAFPTIA